MKLFKKKDKGEKGEKEYLDWLYNKVKEGVNPSYKPSPTTTTTNKVACPECGSDQIRGAGYRNRLECRKCGKIFT